MTPLQKMMNVVGDGWTQDPDIMAPYLKDSRGYKGACSLLVWPRSTQQVSSLLNLCFEERIPVVPQGGNTGRCGGAIPGSKDSLLLSMERMNALGPPKGTTLQADAGCRLQSICEYAESLGYLFPLHLGSQGSCHIGGNIATNAGGLNVLKYGMTRQLIAGLEVVLPDGKVWSDFSGLAKDNTGYDLKNIFVGSEGTLGVVTKALLKLSPKPRSRMTVLCALDKVEACLPLLDLHTPNLSAAELIARTAFQLMEKQALPASPLPDSPWTLLLEYEIHQDEEDEILQTLSEHVPVSVLAQTQQQAQSFWALREHTVLVQDRYYSLKHDVSVPVGRIPAFLRTLEAFFAGRHPELVFYPFGHLGDGSVHCNVLGTSPFVSPLREKLEDFIYQEVYRLGGVLSAEHGIGQEKVRHLARYKDPVSLDLMLRLKTAWDPRRIMNPGKLFSEELFLP